MKLPLELFVSVLVVIVVGASFACAADMPQISGDIGPCTAQFKVTNGDKPVYDAKIHTIIRYGFLNKRKTELEIGTDAKGQAKFTGLPQEVKKPIEFMVRSQGMTKKVTHDPATNCRANFEVSLGAK